MKRARIVSRLLLVIAGMTAVDAVGPTATETHIPVFVTIVDARPLREAIANIEPAPKTVARFPYRKISETAVDCSKLVDTQPVALGQGVGPDRMCHRSKGQ